MDRTAKTEPHHIQWMPVDTLPPCTSGIRSIYNRIAQIAQQSGGVVQIHAGIRTEENSTNASLRGALKTCIVADLYIEITWKQPCRRAEAFLIHTEEKHIVTLVVDGAQAQYTTSTPDGIVAPFRAYSNPRRVQRIATKIKRLLRGAVGTGGESKTHAKGEGA